MPLESYFTPAFSSAAPVATHYFSARTSNKRKRGNEFPEGIIPVRDTLDSPQISALRTESIDNIEVNLSNQHRTTNHQAIRQAIDEDLSLRDLAGVIHQRTKSQDLKGKKLRPGHQKITAPLYFLTRYNRASLRDSSSTSGLRHRHLAAMNAVMHRYVLNCDFVRAGRAWGMILRSEQGGHFVDLRTNDQWGLGAEILLQRQGQLADWNSAENKVSAHRKSAGVNHQACDPSSQEGFAKAKDYYERLILQYPYRKAFPDTSSSLDFCLAIFGLWIHSVQEEQSLVWARIQASRGVLQDGGRPSDESMKDLDPILQSDHPQKMKRIRRETLHHAQKIRACLDELFISPPFCDNVKFVELRTMVQVWVSDLAKYVLSTNSGANAIDN